MRLRSFFEHQARVVCPAGRPPKVLNPLDRHYVNLREELNRTFNTIGLAA